MLKAICGFDGKPYISLEDFILEVEELKNDIKKI